MTKNLIFFLFIFVTTAGCATTRDAGVAGAAKPQELLYMSMTRIDDNSKLRYAGGVPAINSAALASQCEKTVVVAESAPWPVFFVGRIINFAFGQISQSLEKKLKQYTAQLEVTHSPETFFRISDPGNNAIEVTPEVLCVQVTRASCPSDWDKTNPGNPVCADDKQTTLFDLVLKIHLEDSLGDADVKGSYFRLEPLQLYYKETKALSRGKSVVEVRASADAVWRDGNESFRREIFDESLLKETLTVSGGRAVDKIGKVAANLKTYDALANISEASSTRLPILPWSEPANEYVAVGELKIVINEVGDAPTLLKSAHKFLTDNQSDLVDLVKGSIVD